MNFNQPPAAFPFVGAPYQPMNNSIVVPAPPAKQSRYLDILAAQTDADITAFHERYVERSKRAADNLDADPRLLKSYHLHEQRFEMWYDKFIQRRKHYNPGPCGAWELESPFGLAKVVTQYLLWLVENTHGQSDTSRVGVDVLWSWADAMIQLAKIKIVDNESRPGANYGTQSRRHLGAWYGVLEDGSDSLQRLVHVWVDETARKLKLPSHGNPVNDSSEMDLDAPPAKKLRAGDEADSPSPNEGETSNDQSADKSDEESLISYQEDSVLEDPPPLTVDGFWASIEAAWDALPKPRTARCMLLSPHEEVREDHAYELDREVDAMKEVLYERLNTYAFDDLDAWSKYALEASSALDKAGITDTVQGDSFVALQSFAIAAGKKYYDAIIASPKMAVTVGDSAKGVCDIALNILAQRNLDKIQEEG